MIQRQDLMSWSLYPIYKLEIVKKTDADQLQLQAQLLNNAFTSVDMATSDPVVKSIY
jgi:hypothetical protein